MMTAFSHRPLPDGLVLASVPDDAERRAAAQAIDAGMAPSAWLNLGALFAAGLLGCSGGGSGSTTPDGSTPADASMSQEGGGATDAGPGTDTGPTSGSDGGTPYCPFAAPADGSACSGVELLGSPMVSTCMGAEPPGGQGGEVQNGRYVLQSIALYSDNCPPSAARSGRVIWIVCGNDWAAADDFPGADGGPDLLQYDVVAATSGSQLSLTLVCPHVGSSAPPIQYEYTATPGHLSLIYTVNNDSWDGLGYSFTEVDSFALE